MGWSGLTQSKSGTCHVNASPPGVAGYTPLCKLVLQAMLGPILGNPRQIGMAEQPSYLPDCDGSLPYWVLTEWPRYLHGGEGTAAGAGHQQCWLEAQVQKQLPAGYPSWPPAGRAAVVCRAYCSGCRCNGQSAAVLNIHGHLCGDGSNKSMLLS